MRIEVLHNIQREDPRAVPYRPGVGERSTVTEQDKLPGAPGGQDWFLPGRDSQNITLPRATGRGGAPACRVGLGQLALKSGGCSSRGAAGLHPGGDVTA